MSRGLHPFRAFALRLQPGSDLRRDLEQIVTQRGLKAACVVSAVGSLTRAAIRYAGESAPAAIEGPFEIVSLSGTFSLDGAHLHISVADSNGIVIGGHLSPGSIVHTTAEVVIGTLEGISFHRDADRSTGYRELAVRGVEEKSRQE